MERADARARPRAPWAAGVAGVLWAGLLLAGCASPPVDPSARQQLLESCRGALRERLPEAREASLVEPRVDRIGPGHYRVAALLGRKRQQVSCEVLAREDGLTVSRLALAQW